MFMGIIKNTGRIRRLRSRIAAGAGLTALLCSCVCSYAAEPAEYKDIPEDWSRESIIRAIDAGIITGDTDGYIKPDSTVTRAELSAMLVRLFGVSGSGAAEFSDVSAEDWYYSYVCAAAENGFMTGSGGMFRPNDAVTRQEAVTAAARAFFIPPSQGTLSGFADAGTAADWARGYFAALIERGAVTGSGDMLYPEEPITKKEAAAVMLRCSELPDLPVRESDGSVWSPVY